MKLRLLVTLIGALIAFGMLVCPPWMEFYTQEDGNFARRHLGYHVVWDKPDEIVGLKSGGVRVWSSRLSTQLFVLFGATLIARKLASKRAKL